MIPSSCDGVYLPLNAARRFAYATVFRRPIVKYIRLPKDLAAQSENLSGNSLNTKASALTSK